MFDREGGEVGTAGAAGRGGEEESNGGGRGEKKDNGTDSGGGKKNGGGENVSKNKSKPVFRAYDSLGYKNMVCAKELSSALEEHLILEGDDIEGEAAAAEEKATATEDLDAADGGTEERSRRLRQRRRLDAAASRTRSVAPTRVLNFVQGRCPRQGNASDCGIYILGKRTEKVRFFFFLRAVDPKRSQRNITLTSSSLWHLSRTNKFSTPALAERIAAGRSKGLPYREIEEQLFREVTPSFAEEERERLRLLVEEVGRSRRENDGNAAAKRKAAAPKKAPKKKGG